MALGQSKRRPKRSVIFLSIQFSSIFFRKTTLTTTTTAMTVVDDDDWATKLCYVFKVTLWFNRIFKERKTFFFIFVLKMSAPLFLLFKREGKNNLSSLFPIFISTKPICISLDRCRPSFDFGVQLYHSSNETNWGSPLKKRFTEVQVFLKFRTILNAFYRNGSTMLVSLTNLILDSYSQRYRTKQLNNYFAVKISKKCENINLFQVLMW